MIFVILHNSYHNNGVPTHHSTHIARAQACATERQYTELHGPLLRNWMILGFLYVYTGSRLTRISSIVKKPLDCKAPGVRQL